jgi:hypothetical protein
MTCLRKLDICWFFGPSESSAPLLQALKRNCSLWEFIIVFMIHLWSKAVTNEIAFYAKRNKRIHAILDVLEDTVQRATLANYWPRIFRAMRGG